MQKFHPLTEKLAPILRRLQNGELVFSGEIDGCIGTELEEIARKLSHFLGLKTYGANDSIRLILGLSTESEPDERCKHGVHGTDCFKCFDQEENPKPKTAEEWCYHLQNRGEGLKLYQDGANKSHILGQSHTTYFQFCPICGAPRPTEKTLEQKFREYLFTRYPLIKNDDVVWLVKTAEEHYGGKKS